MTPEVRAVANALLAAQCLTGVCVRDVTDYDPTLRMRLELMARNLLADPRPLLDALLGTVDRDQIAAMAAEERTDA